MLLLKVSGKFIHGSLEKMKDSKGDFNFNTGYLVKDIATHSSLTTMACAKECFIQAHRHSTVCAGIVTNDGSCLVLFPDIGDVQALITINGVDLLNCRTLYLYKPRIGKIPCLIFATLAFFLRMNHNGHKGVSGVT